MTISAHVVAHSISPEGIPIYGEWQSALDRLEMILTPVERLQARRLA